MTDSPPCFNCCTSVDVHPYSFDLDLPTLYGCQMCILALSMGDDETLRDLAPRRRRTRTKETR